MNINESIGKLIDSRTEHFRAIRIRIECPLPSGIKLSTKLESDEGSRSIAIPGDLRPFHQFVKSAQASRSERFNIVVIVIQPSGEWQASYSYDDELQKWAEEP